MPKKVTPKETAKLAEKMMSPKPHLPFHPKGDTLIVIPHTQDEMEGRFFIPESCRKPLTQGTVFSVGPEVTRAVPGEEILWTQHMEQEIQFDGQKFFCLQDCHVIAGNAEPDPEQGKLPL